MTYIDTPLVKKVSYIAKRKWEPNIQHYSKADNLWACFKIAEWGVFCHLRTLQTLPTRFNQVQSDSTQIIEGVAAESNTAINVVCEGYVFTSL